jgi:hypothetical protein
MDIPSTSTISTSSNNRQHTKFPITNNTTKSSNNDDSNYPDNISEASTIIRQPVDIENNYAGIYNDNYHTFCIQKRHLGRGWKNYIDKLQAIIPSLQLYHYAGYIHFLFDLEFKSTLSVDIMHQILRTLNANKKAYQHALVTLVHITRKDIYISFCQQAYKPVTKSPANLSNIRMRI